MRALPLDLGKTGLSGSKQWTWMAWDCRDRRCLVLLGRGLAQEEGREGGGEGGREGLRGTKVVDGVRLQRLKGTGGRGGEQKTCAAEEVVVDERIQQDGRRAGSSSSLVGRQAPGGRLEVQGDESGGIEGGAGEEGDAGEWT
ncbi:hypothetical protein NSK_007943 [Nannochloropsis salina CCMP1776]|uniref:Uncharacterized protein n=1 Tax=Nannochloropsis salina CCMP1776 TaxID=1027361 RepID=A0A4D9CPU7_9STRA|nr:hypothetical protein NSK_007943 [Nannochloropsis salina CCMP1776]|eukprot:TFJ80766.1 hypothetical protein NSK_007943 [Nannochloropsis salina CCMP1776]